MRIHLLLLATVPHFFLSVIRWAPPRFFSLLVQEKKLEFSIRFTLHFDRMIEH